MPPKAKFTKEEIISSALNIVKSNGLSALTARALGNSLGCSSRPVFTVFSSMDEVEEEVIKKAKEIYKTEYVEKGLKQEIPFKGVGTEYIKFAESEPKLFQLLFMREVDSGADINSVLGIIEESYELILNSIVSYYGLSVPCAEKLYKHLWIYTHGIAVLIATNVCNFTGEEISLMLTEVFIGLLKKLKTEDDV